jgi:flavin-dependent dehydrogenase
VCATLLARAGGHVVLLNAPGSRRSRVELLSGRARWLLRDLDLPTPRGVELAETISLWGSDRPLCRSTMFDPYGTGLAIERTDLDRLLLESSATHGAIVVSERVGSISRSGDVWEIVTRARRFLARRIVLATGTTPGVFIRRQSEVVSRQTAFLYRTSEPSRLSLSIERTSRGWWYALPVPAGGTFIGYCTEPPLGRDSSGRWFQHALQETGIIPRPARGEPGDVWGVPAGIRTYERATGSDWLAIGDAAFSPDPLCGEGIWFACETARSAADVMLGRSSSAAYQRWVDSAVRSHLQGRADVCAC